MAGGDYTRLKGVDSFNSAGFDSQLIESLITFFDWTFLCRDAFNTVSKDYGERGKLKPTDNPLVWESSKANWVWESSFGTIPEAMSQPVSIDGIYIDNIFSANNLSSYYINYRDGQIVFNEPPNPNSVISLNYSYKRYNFYDADTEWFRQVIFDPLEEKGLIEVLSQHRVYLPAIIIEYVPSGRLVPFQIGSGVTYYQYQDVIFHILADEYEDRNKASYAFIKQLDKTFYIYDLNKIADANDFPLDINGTPIQNPKLYPQLVDTYPYAKGLFFSVSSQEITKDLSLFRASVRATIRINVF